MTLGGRWRVWVDVDYECLEVDLCMIWQEKLGCVGNLKRSGQISDGQDVVQLMTVGLFGGVSFARVVKDIVLGRIMSYHKAFCQAMGYCLKYCRWT